MGYLSQRWYHPMKEKSTALPSVCAAKKAKQKAAAFATACLFVCVN